jgi:hypothetical protein
VYAIAELGAIVYVGGAFLAIGGQSRSRIAALDAITGLATSWNPGADDVVYSIDTAETAIYAAGGFDFIDGDERSGIASWRETTTGAPLHIGVSAPALWLASPNPTRNIARVRFSLDAAAVVSLQVFDVSGRLVATLLSHRQLSSGLHEETIATSSWPSGVYFIRLVQPSGSSVIHLVALR